MKGKNSKNFRNFFRNKFFEPKNRKFSSPQNGVKMAKMTKFVQIVDFGQAYDPTPEFETKTSKSKNCRFGPIWGFLTLKWVQSSQLVKIRPNYQIRLRV